MSDWTEGLPAPVSTSGARYKRRAGQIGIGCPAAIAAGAEIHQDHPAVASHHHVLRLDVAMQQPRGVNRRDRAAERLPDRRDLARREVPAILDDELMQRAAVDVFHPQADRSSIRSAP